MRLTSRFGDYSQPIDVDLASNPSAAQVASEIQKASHLFRREGFIETKDQVLEMTKTEKTLVIDKWVPEVNFPGEPKMIFGIKIHVITWRQEKRSKIIGINDSWFTSILVALLAKHSEFSAPIIDFPEDCEIDGPYARPENRQIDFVVSHGSYDVVPDGQELPRIWEVEWRKGVIRREWLRASPLRDWP